MQCPACWNEINPIDGHKCPLCGWDLCRRDGIRLPYGGGE